MMPQAHASPVVVALLAQAAASIAFAQEELIGTYIWEVATQDGDALVEPGETATISMFLDLTPDPVDPSESGVQGLSGMIFDTLGGAGADNGFISGWTANPLLTFLTGDLTTTDGVSLFFTNLGQTGIGFGGLPATEDPLPLLDFEWTPIAEGRYDVQYTSSTHFLEVWYGKLFDAVSTPTAPVDTSVTFSVVPTPPIAAGPLLAILMTNTRRRRHLGPTRGPSFTR